MAPRDGVICAPSFETKQWPRNVEKNRPVTGRHIPEKRGPQMHQCASLKIRIVGAQGRYDTSIKILGFEVTRSA